MLDRPTSRRRQRLRYREHPEQLSCSDPSFHVAVLFRSLADALACSNPLVSESKPPCARLSNSRPGTLATMGRSDRRRGACRSCSYVLKLTLTLIYTKVRIAVQPSVMNHIARSVSLVGQRKKLAAYRACDIAFNHVHSIHTSFFLVV